jgi:hypothetical protein
VPSLRPVPAVRPLTALAVLLAAACGDPAAPRCTIALERFPNDVVVAGTQRRAVARTTCDRGTPSVRWSVSDTAVATVDATGLVTGRAPGIADLIAETGGAGGVRATVRFGVAPPYVVVLSPRRIDVLPRGRVPLNLSVVPTDFLPAGFPNDVDVATTDSCVAIVDAQGFVAAGRAGTATITVRLRAAPGVRDTAGVVVGVPVAARTFVARLTDASGADADPRALRGRVTVLVNTLYPATGGRLEVRLGGRVAGTVLLAPPTSGIAGPVRLPVTIETAARDAAGAPRFPDGAQTLEAVLVVPDVPGLPGCPAVNLGDRDAQPVTLANG